MAESQTHSSFSWRSHPRFIVLTIAVGQFSDFFLFGMRVPLLPYLVREHLHVPQSEVQTRVAALLASFSIATLLAAVPAGWLADFPSSRSRLYLAGLGALFWATVTFYTSGNYTMMIFSRVLNGLSAALLFAAGFSMVADAVAPGDLGKALGTIRSIVAVGELVGPPLGGFVFSRWGFVGILNVSLGVLTVDLLMRLTMVEKPREMSAGRKLIDGDSEAVGCGTTRAEQVLPGCPEYSTHRSPKMPLPILSCLVDPQLAVALLLSFIQYIILGSYDSTLALEASTRFGLSPEAVGIIFLALAIPVLTFAPLAGWAVDRFGPRVVAVTGYSCFAPSLAAMLLLPPTNRPSLCLITFYGFLAVQGVCLALVSTPSVVKAKQAVEKAVHDDPARFGPRGATGQMFGLNTLVSSFGLLIGNYFGAVLRKALGYGGMSLVLAGGCMVAASLAASIFSEDGRGARQCTIV